MALIRLVLFASVGWILWHLVKKSHTDSQHPETEEVPPPSIKQGGKMVQCDHCGLHFPEQEAVYLENATFCCEEHKMLNYSPKTH